MKPGPIWGGFERHEVSACRWEYRNLLVMVTENELSKGSLFCELPIRDLAFFEALVAVAAGDGGVG